MDYPQPISSQAGQKARQIVPVWVVVFTCLGLFIPQWAAGQSFSLADAQRLSADGKYEQAGKIYDQLLQQQPDRIAVIIAKGYNESWQGQHAEARVTFTQVLQKDPENLDAISGLAYNFAWQGELGRARVFFRKLLEQSPNHLEGLKGLAYVALWEKDGLEAIRRFESLTEYQPNNPDLLVSLAQAYMLDQRHISARTTLQKVLSISPQHSVAKELMGQLSTTPALLELQIWGGISRFNTQTKTGIRAARVAWQANQDLQLWLRFDNALTFDNFALTRQNQQIAAWFGGGMINWNAKLTTRLEVGFRNLDSLTRQWFVQGEQVFYLPGNHALRVGGFYGPRNDQRSEWMSYLGGVISLRPHFRLEPTYFYARNGIDPTTDHRFLLAGNYRFPGGLELNSGAQIGRTVTEASQQGLWGGHAIAHIPVGLHWLQALFRYEKGPAHQLLVGALGVRFRLER